MVKTSIEPTITIQQAGQNKYCEQNLNHHISQWSKQELSLQTPIYGWFTTSFVAQTKSQPPYITMVKTRVEFVITNLRMVEPSIVAQTTTLYPNILSYPKYIPTGILKAESITRMIDNIQRANLQPHTALKHHRLQYVPRFMEILTITLRPNKDSSTKLNTSRHAKREVPDLYSPMKVYKY